MAKKALCVGINRFRNYPSATLNGCVNDAHEMKKLLTEHFGFSAKKVTTLTDSKATKQNIMAKLREMVEGAIAGKYDYLVFSFSSHGTQVPDTGNDEPDLADEAFCPYDLRENDGQWHAEHIITDDELNRLFADLPAQVTLEAFFDTCHSGTGLRAVDFAAERKPRYLSPPSIEAFLQIEALKPRGLRDLLPENENIQHILWAGCQADQTSADALIEGGWHGAFTYFLCREIRASGNTKTRELVLKNIRTALKYGRYTQIPQLECNDARKTSPSGS
ncbi:MAG: caspase family protein [Chlorobium sp.]|uniref:caspase family protein n=1 Tax=Chlorobium sp. TaxID=1095 RepID=UPI0025C241F8|nr:caspase family protein [Chlorobium sp.]MCF8382384.1 caspase family protein [Chlorobium sp.]